MKEDKEINESKVRGVFQFGKVLPEPKFQIKRGKKWIEFGEDNQLPTYVEGLLDDSPAHYAIVQGTANMIAGEGWDLPETVGNNLRRFFDNEDAEVEEQTNLDDLLRLVASDLKTYGAFAINVRWSRDGKTIAALHYVDVRKVRIAVGVENAIEGVKYYFIHPDWVNTRRVAPKLYQGYSRINKEERSQLLYVKLPSPANKPYGMPDYWSAREAIEIDQAIQDFQLRRLKEGFFPSVIITVPRLAQTNEEQDKFYKELQDFFGGNSGAAAILDGDYKFEKFDPSSTPEDFEFFQKNVNQKIKEAHKVPAKGQIFGLSQPEGGMTFSNEEIINEFELFQQTVVRNYQKLIEDVFNKLAREAGVEEQLKIVKYQLFANDVEEDQNESTNIE